MPNNVYRSRLSSAPVGGTSAGTLLQPTPNLSQWVSRSTPLKELNYTKMQQLSLSTIKEALRAASPRRTLPLKGQKRKFDIDSESEPSQPSKKPTPTPIVQLQQFIDSFLQVCRNSRSDIPNFDWYRRLQIQSASLTFFNSQDQDITPQLLEDPVINQPYDVPDLSVFNFKSNLQKLIKDGFEHIEKQRQKVLAELELDSQAETTPIFEDLALSLRTGFPSTAPSIGIEFVSAPFYFYSFLRTYAPFCNLSTEPDFDYTAALKVVTLLIARMMDTYDGHRSLEFMKILCHLFPNNESYRWSSMISKQEPSMGLIYRRFKDEFPMLMVQVCEDSSKGGSLLLNNHRKYMESLERFKSIQKYCGYPVMYIQLAGTRLSFGGAISSMDMGPHSQPLPGSVELKPDYGSNLREGAFSFWALRKAFDLLEAEVPVLSDEKETEESISDKKEPKVDDKKLGLGDKEKAEDLDDRGLKMDNGESNPYFKTHQPHVGLEDQFLDITETIRVGIIYKAKLDPRRPMTDEVTATNALEDNIEYLVKAVYPHKEEAYGAIVHQLLARLKFAPAYYLSLSPKLEDIVEDADMLKRFGELQSVPLITYHFMQFLSPPTAEKAGYITLEDLADNARGVAVSARDSIKSTLFHILEILSSNKMVHGDLRPNNIMVKMELMVNDSYHLCMREEEPNLVDLKIIDFNWAGRQGEVRYPLSKNSAVDWPGKVGELISQDDDRKMVEAWIQSWPYKDEPMKRKPMKVKVKGIA